MPELPEVETTVHGLQVLVNCEINDIHVYSRNLRYKIPQNISFLLKNNKITKIFRLGKYIIINLYNELSILIHLGMSGRLRIYKHSKFIKVKHDRFIVFFKENILVFNDVRKFGFIDVFKTKEIEKNRFIKKLGVDALDKKLNAEYIIKKIIKSIVPIKQILLNQNIISGIGNIYACEILFDAKISPFKRGCDLNISELKILIISIKKILKKAIKSGGSSLKDYKAADGTLGNFQKNFKVYNLEGRKINGKEILRVKQYGRSTFYCPKIQF